MSRKWVKMISRAIIIVLVATMLLSLVVPMLSVLGG